MASLWSVADESTAGGDLDQTESFANTEAPLSIAMNMAHVFTAPGTADLVCSAVSAGLSANFATVSGIQVTNLTRADG